MKQGAPGANDEKDPGEQRASGVATLQAVQEKIKEKTGWRLSEQFKEINGSKKMNCYMPFRH